MARLVLEPLGDEGVQQQIDDCLTAIRRRDIEAQLKGLKEEMHAQNGKATWCDWLTCSGSLLNCAGP